MRIEDFLVFSVIIFNTILSFLIIQRDRGRRNLSFFSLIFFLNGYFLINTLIDYDFDNSILLPLAKLVFFFPTFLPYLLTLFISSFLEKVPRTLELFLKVYLGVTLVLSTLALFTDKIVLGIDSSTYPLGIIRGNLYGIYIVSVALLLVLFLGVVGYVRTKLRGLERLQFYYFMLGAISTMFLVVVSNLILPALGINKFVRLPGLFSILFTGATTYAIVRHKLFSIKTMMLIALKYFFLTVLFMVAVFGVRLVKDNILHVGYYSYQSVLIDSVVALLIAFYVEPFLNFLNDYLGWIIKPEVVMLAGLLDEINNKVGGDLDYKQSLHEVINVIKKHFVYSQVFLISNNENEVKVYPDGVDINMKEFSPLLDKIEGTVLLQGGNNEYSEVEVKLLNQSVVIASQITPNLYIFFANKHNNQAYTKSEIDIIYEMINELRQIFSMLEINDRVSSFNTVLQEKIDKATAELKEKNTQLEETLRKERDMMDILGHELRTPLTIGRNAMKVLKKKYEDSGKIDKKTLDKYLEMADENLSRESNLLETLLSTTKIDNNGIDLHLEKVDLVDVINDSLDAHRPKAKEKGLDLNYEPPKEAFVFADRNRMQEVVDNLIDNAIKYTNEGSVSIEIESQKKMTELKVIDTGVGISKADLDKLGQKFYRINTYLDSSKESDYKVVRPGGTGLGLYVTFNLVDLMGGGISVDSEVGTGSTFSIQIPTFSGQEIKDEGKRSPSGKTVFEKFEEKKGKMDNK